jgi:hypothetical protein
VAKRGKETAMSSEPQAAWTASQKPEQKAPLPGGYRGIINNILTVLLAALIVLAGFASPNLLYPVLDPYHDDIVTLSSDTGPMLELHVFDEPVSLYPWNLYDPASVRTITSVERDMLRLRNVPHFLLQVAEGFGLDIKWDDLSQLESYIANSFVYMNTDAQNESGCYLLPELDINNDGIIDLRCAADVDGNIISMAALTQVWPTAEPETSMEIWDFTNFLASISAEDGQTKIQGAATVIDDGYAARYGHEYQRPTPKQAATDQDNQNSDTPADGEAPQSNTTNPEDGTASDNLTQLEADSNSAQPPTSDATAQAVDKPETSATDSVPAPADANAPAGVTTNTNAPEIAVQADSGAQEQTDAQSQADAQEQSSVSAQSAQSAVAASSQSTSADTVPFALTPIIFASEDYLYYIYDLANGTRFILYLDPATSHCRGFNLQS